MENTDPCSILYHIIRRHLTLLPKKSTKISPSEPDELYCTIVINNLIWLDTDLKGLNKGNIIEE